MAFKRSAVQFRYAPPLKARYHISGFFNINACSPKKILKKVELVLSGVTVKCFDINNLLLSRNTEYRAIS